MTGERALEAEEAVRLIAFSGFARYAPSMSIDPTLASFARQVLLVHHDKMETPFLEPSFLDDFFGDRRGAAVRSRVIDPVISLLENGLWLWDAPLYRILAYEALMDGTPVQPEVIGVLRTCSGHVRVPSRVRLPVSDPLDQSSLRWFGRRWASVAIRRAIGENALRLFFRCLDGVDVTLRSEIIRLAKIESRLLGVPGELPNPGARR